MFYSTSKIPNPQVSLKADAAFHWLRLGILCEGVVGWTERGNEEEELVKGVGTAKVEKELITYY